MDKASLEICSIARDILPDEDNIVNHAEALLKIEKEIVRLFIEKLKDDFATLSDSDSE